MFHNIFTVLQKSFSTAAPNEVTIAVVWLSAAALSLIQALAAVVNGIANQANTMPNAGQETNMREPGLHAQTLVRAQF